MNISYVFVQIVCVCVCFAFLCEIISRIVARIAYAAALRETLEGFKVKIGAGNQHHYTCKNHPTTTAAVVTAAANTIIMTKNIKTQTRRQTSIGLPTAIE